MNELIQKTVIKSLQCAWLAILRKTTVLKFLLILTFSWQTATGSRRRESTKCREHDSRQKSNHEKGCNRKGWVKRHSKPSHTKKTQKLNQLTKVVTRSESCLNFNHCNFGTRKILTVQQNVTIYCRQDTQLFCDFNRNKQS